MPQRMNIALLNPLARINPATQNSVLQISKEDPIVSFCVTSPPPDDSQLDAPLPDPPLGPPPVDVWIISCNSKSN